MDKACVGTRTLIQGCLLEAVLGERIGVADEELEVIGPLLPPVGSSPAGDCRRPEPPAIEFPPRQGPLWRGKTKEFALHSPARGHVGIEQRLAVEVRWLRAINDRSCDIGREIVQPYQTSKMRRSASLHLCEILDPQCAMFIDEHLRAPCFSDKSDQLRVGVPLAVS